MLQKAQHTKKEKFILYAWGFIIFGIICFLCFHFYPIVDDLVFAGKLKYNQWDLRQIITVNGVNGRYIGNALGIFFSCLSTTALWPIRAIFNIICMLLLFIYIIKATGYNFYSFLFIPVCMLVPNIYHFHQYYGFSADFMNYLLPLLLLFVNYDLIKQYIFKKTKILLFIIPFTVFINCFFIEHITVYIVACCFAATIYALIKKKNISFFVTLSISSVIGLLCMFLHKFVFSSESGYRETALSQGIPWILTNITDNIKYVIFDHLFLTGFISLICFICLIKYSGKNILKKTAAIFIITVLLMSCLCSFCLYFGNWKNTPLSFIVNKYFVTVLTFLFLLSIGAVILFFMPKEKITADTYIFYISIWFICAMLSAVSPLGPRCFMITYVFLTIIAVRLFSMVAEQIKVHPKTIVIVACLLFTALYTMDVCRAYYTGNEVMQERFEYIEDQMSKKAEVIELPDSVNFTDAGGLNFINYLYYYNSPEDIEFTFVPYDEWITIKNENG